MGARRAPALPLFPLLLAFVASTGTLAAQQADEPVLWGRLLVGDVTADSGTVVLHRITPEEAGAVDSVQVGPGGEFRFILPGVSPHGGGEVFLASVRYEGVLYFGDPIAGMEQLEEPYRLQAYPTRAVPPGQVSFPVSVRNVFLEEGPLGWRVTDLLEIRNDSAVTFVADPEESPLWSYPLTEEGRGFRTAQGEASPESVRFRNGVLELYGPVPPGERLIIVQYDVEPMEFSVPMPGRTDVIEFLLREPAPSLRIEGMSPRQPVELEAGSSYLRWAGEDLEDRVVRVREGEEGEDLLAGWMVLLLALILGGVGVWVVSRRGAPARTPAASTPEAPEGARRRKILLRIAHLDEEFGDPEHRSPEERDRYRRRREDLLARLEGVRGDDDPTQGEP